MSPGMLVVSDIGAQCPACHSTQKTGPDPADNGRDIEWFFFDGEPGSGCGCPYCDQAGAK
jgi:hypothetical protein